MRLAVVSDNWRAVIEVPEVESGSALLPDFQFMRLLTKLSPDFVAQRPRHLDLRRNVPALFHNL